MKKYEVIKPFRIDFTKIEKPPKIKQSTMFEKTKKPSLPNKDSTKKNK
tara:strand:- start:11 stop:154 length:144 start_codon:yes stop_codon:yes gene_type:complete